MYNYVKDYSGLPFFVQGTLTSNKSGFPCTHAPVLRIAYAKALLKNLGPANATSSSAAICLPRGLALRSECYRTAVVSDAKNVALRNGLGKPRASYVAASICAKPFRKDCESSGEGVGDTPLSGAMKHGRHCSWQRQLLQLGLGVAALWLYHSRCYWDRVCR